MSQHHAFPRQLRVHLYFGDLSTVSDAWPAPANITGRFVNTVTRGWVGAPNGRAPSRFHGAVVGFVARCLSGTRNLAASNKHLAEFFSGRSWPKIGRGIIFFGVFEKFETFFSKICAHSERYRNLFAGIFEIVTFYGNIAFPLSPVLDAHFEYIDAYFELHGFKKPSPAALLGGPAGVRTSPTARGAGPHHEPDAYVTP